VKEGFPGSSILQSSLNIAYSKSNYLSKRDIHHLFFSSQSTIMI
jgi:hypothetical protein